MAEYHIISAYQIISHYIVISYQFISYHRDSSRQSCSCRLFQRDGVPLKHCLGNLDKWCQEMTEAVGTDGRPSLPSTADLWVRRGSKQYEWWTAFAPSPTGPWHNVVPIRLWNQETQYSNDIYIYKYIYILYIYIDIIYIYYEPYTV